MHRCRAIKKKTRNRLILLQNLKKGKARQESRCGYKLIPLPAKFTCSSSIHYLPGDTVLMERDDTIVSEASLLNNFKTYKTAQVVEYPTQKVIKLKVENKNSDNDSQISDWKQIVERLGNSESDDLKQWANPIKNYCERYETLVKELQNEQQGMSAERYKALLQKNDMTEKIRQTLFKTNPCIEFKSQLKDGQIQLTEISVSEKYLGELGYSLETFSATVLQEGLPEVTPLDSEGASVIAKLRLQKYLTTDQDGYQTPEFESSVIMKNGCLKKVKLRVHYQTCYEKGVPGFVFIGAIIAKQKPMIRNLNTAAEIKLNTDYIEMMSRQEENMNMFLQAYYNQTVEQKFTNIHKICKIKQIKDLDGVL